MTYIASKPSHLAMLLLVHPLGIKSKGTQATFYLQQNLIGKYSIPSTTQQCSTLTVSMHSVSLPTVHLPA